ncbi:MAG: hypothetical protein ABJB22_05205, partial [Verrucomicrobiota bacterium]
GFAEAGAIWRQLSTVHSRQRCANQFIDTYCPRCCGRYLQWPDPAKTGNSCDQLTLVPNA